MYEVEDNTDIQSRGDTFSLARIFGFGKTREEWRGPGHHGMKVYIAAMYDRHPEMVRVAQHLRNAGFTVCSSWVYGNEQHVPDKITRPTHHDQAMGRIAQADLNELDQADCVLFFAEPTGTAVPGGGRNFEMGYAYALDKNIFVIGGCEHVFHYLPIVYAQHFTTLSSWINYMKKGVTNEA